MEWKCMTCRAGVGALLEKGAVEELLPGALRVGWGGDYSHYTFWPPGTPEVFGLRVFGTSRGLNFGLLVEMFCMETVLNSQGSSPWSTCYSSFQMGDSCCLR